MQRLFSLYATFAFMESKISALLRKFLSVYHCEYFDIWNTRFLPCRATSTEESNSCSSDLSWALKLGITTAEIKQTWLVTSTICNLLEDFIIAKMIDSFKQYDKCSVHCPLCNVHTTSTFRYHIQTKFNYYNGRSNVLWTSFHISVKLKSSAKSGPHYR